MTGLVDKESTELPEEGGGAILVVDDEESLRTTFELFLKREGYQSVFVASSFGEALALLDHHDFDLIVSDIVLEGESGIDLLRRARERGRTCPVIMITGYPNVKTAAEAVRLGAFDYLPKPVTKDALLRVTRLALRQRQLEKAKIQAEAQRERYRTYLETVFRSVRDAIIALDGDLRIIQANEAARICMRELSGEDFLGKFVGDIPGPLGKDLLRDAERVLKTREDVPEHRIEIVRPDSTCKVVSIAASPMRGARGEFLGVVIVARDMTILDHLAHRGGRTRFHRLIGASPAMQMIYAMIENVGKVDTTVLITGESGTGKELVAEALHAESPRRDRKLVKVDCTAIPENLLESELFGHKKGSFTGADRDRMGRILQADGGTLFLDEIGDISPLMQLRLLRFLQERTFYPVGQDSPIQVDVRVIAATNADLRKKVEEGAFREDLYFRLRVIDIKLPPLRERFGDIPLLARHFLEKFSRRIGKELTGISDQAIELLERYPWPGNVRQLEHVMERACVLCPGATISTEEIDLEPVSREAGGHLLQPGVEEVSRVGAAQNGLDDLSEHERIVEALKRTGGNKAKAARLLGIDRSTLYRKIRMHGLDLSFLEK